jgi:ligand-binding sensor domain-containing protein
VGDEWLAGTYGAGVLRLDASGEWHSFPDLKPDFVVNPNAMAVSAGQVYVGTLDRGLFIFDRASGRWTNSTVGLPSKNVTALAVGGGYLYTGTDNGLVRIAEGILR